MRLRRQQLNLQTASYGFDNFTLNKCPQCGIIHGVKTYKDMPNPMGRFSQRPFFFLKTLISACFKSPIIAENKRRFGFGVICDFGARGGGGKMRRCCGRQW